MSVAPNPAPVDQGELMRWYRCRRKHPYGSHGAAVAEVVRAHPGGSYEAYACPYADHWHVGHVQSHAINAKTRSRAKWLWKLEQQKRAAA